MSSPAVPLARAKAAGWLRSFVRAAIPVVTGTCVIAIALVLTQQLSGRSPFVGVALALIAVLPIWMFFSTSYGATLAVLALYLGLIDGVLKLTLNSPGATLGRDVLLYSIVIGALARIAISSRPVRFPPLTGYILAFVAIVLVQVLNPQTGGLGRGLAATRPHLEFIPLFFFGFVFMRDTRRLRIFLLLLCAIAAVNGAVGLVQFNLTPDELASWGPGYAERINGTGDLSSRKFRDEATNQEFNRPFALGPDIGFGGAVGIIAVPAFLALLGTARRRWSGRIGVPLGVGIVLAVATSQSRTAVVGAIVAALAFGAFSLLSQRRATALIGLAAAVVLTVLGISLLSGGDNRAALSRYNSIAPSKVLDTTYDYRAGTFALIPKYAVEAPLGQGLGTVGPGASLVRGSSAIAGPEVSGESQFNFLLVELGIGGLVIYCALIVRLLALSGRIRKLADPELRLLLAGCAAPLIGIAVSGIAGPISANTPFSPYIWFIAGVLAYWLLARPRDGHPSAGRVVT